MISEKKSVKKTNYDAVNTRGDYQSAYQLFIYNLADNDGSYIDSGRISSSETTQITISAFIPVSHADYKWCVYVWNSTATSEDIDDATVACDTFTMGLLSGETDWQGAQWLGITDSTNTAYFYHTNEFRFEFSLTQAQAQRGISKARCYIVTPNYYKAWINGNELDQHRLGYFTTFEVRTYYDVIDCTHLVSSSESYVFALMLGQGWYSQASINIGAPMFRVLVYLELSNVTDVVTFTSNSSTWLTHEGPVRMNDIYFGEYYNCAFETPGWLENDYNTTAAGGWVAASEISDPTIGTLVSSAIMPKIEVTESFAPVAVTQPEEGIFVVDFGQNLAGAVEIRIPGNTAKGQNVTMTHSEQLYPNGTVQNIYGASTPMIARYALRGDGEEEVYEPYFVYFGFQYLQIEGFPGVVTTDTVTSHFYHTNFHTNGDISFGPSSVETQTAGGLLNSIQRMTRYSSLSNFMNLPTDCPQRERRAWLGDAQITAEVTIFNFDMGASYTKFLKDIVDAQDFNDKDGGIPDCTPYYSHGRDPGDPTWTAALIFITHWMYRYFGDVQIVEENYANMQQQMAYLDSELDNSSYVLPQSKSTYGDWCAAINANGEVSSPSSCAHTSAIINTWDYVRQCDYMAEMATLLGKDSDAASYSNKSALAKNGVKKNYFDVEKGYFVESGSVAPVSTLQALCLEMGVLDNETQIATTLQAMADDVVVTGKNHLGAGILGVKYVLRALCDLGLCDIALNASIQTSFPSPGSWYENGATTLWEHWAGTRFNSTKGGSKNHIMFGAQGIWYYQYLAGIRQNEDSTNWNQFEVKPYYNASMFDIFYIDATVDAQVGTIYVNFQVQETQKFNETWLTLQVNVPVGTQASVYVTRLAQFGTYVPINDWVVVETVANATIWKSSAFASGAAKGVTSGTMVDDDNVVFVVESGMYIFELQTV